jgi:hypothetical protein
MLSRYGQMPQRKKCAMIASAGEAVVNLRLKQCGAFTGD